MGTVFFEEALLPSGWASNVRIEVIDGLIASATANALPTAADDRAGIGLPGMPNVHSHAFQRGMAGLTEVRGPGHDTFWTWRETMYRLALAMSPEDVQAVAALAYVEMLEAGFTRVGEFHYLHHDRNGKSLADPAEMAARIVAAAEETGIGLTLLPVFYAHGGFGGIPPAPPQRRFICDLEAFHSLLDAVRRTATAHAGSVVGLAPHSLRAVTPEELAALLPLAEEGPIHIHVAEQEREVEECLAWSGRRPVEWLLDHASPDGRWCFIHATHMTARETQRMAEAGVVAGLCPVTEANLGDGIFNAAAFKTCGGRFGIGSDSNVLIGVADELRQLEYDQRLLRGERNVLAGTGGASTGRALYETAVRGGSQALGAPDGVLAPGAPADMVSLDRGNSALLDRHGDQALDSWIFAARTDPVDCVWVRGKKCVEAGRHPARDHIIERCRRSLARLLAAN